ncbi:MAG TPA: aminotransferase class I/II-fold pyridoxal phosphate-dependent enzyme [Solirubrobacteraceae bacterium]|nr:aminotransferase class I/II-fold pyridoxal phosphate-dependent enzyme [Solirubrobacteraceae bacterium]
MGLLDRYRQFEGLSDEEVSADLRAKADARKAEALERVEPIDLSRTTWPGLPHHHVVNAITYAARKGLNRYVDPRAGALRTEIAHHHGISPGQVVVGNGAAQLLASAAAALLEPGDELVTPWPSYPLYPIMARRSHGQAVPVPGFSPDAILAAVSDRTRIVTICNPNDPTGELIGADALDGLLRSLPERVVTFVDEALVDYVDEQAVDANVPLLEAHPRLLLFRSFSKAWGLAGLRCGYALGAPDSGSLLEELEPDLGVNDLAQEGALEALRATSGGVRKRAASVATQRAMVLDALQGTPYEVEASQANVLWMRLPGVEGAELAARLERQGVIVQAGGGLGEPERIRVSVHLPEHALRLVRALELALEEGTEGAGRS